MGRKALSEIAIVAKPETILSWYRRLVAQKFDGSKQRKDIGRPPVAREVVDLVVRMAKENSGWGHDRIVGALSNLGYSVSDQTVGNILRRHGIAPAPKRRQTTTWKDFIAAHMAVLAGIDFFTVEVLTWRGLATHYVLFIVQLESRRVHLAGMTKHPDTVWMEQMARNAGADLLLASVGRSIDGESRSKFGPYSTGTRGIAGRYRRQRKKPARPGSPTCRAPTRETHSRRERTCHVPDTESPRLGRLAGQLLWEAQAPRDIPCSTRTTSSGRPSCSWNRLRPSDKSER